MTDRKIPQSEKHKVQINSILSIFDKLRAWFQRLEFIYKIGLVFLGIAAFLGLSIEEEKVTYDFNTLNGCARGNLEQMRRDTALPANILFLNGAAKMSICDSEALEARKQNFHVALVKKYPGCLRLDDSGALHMQLNRLAVCKDGSVSGARYLCDGADETARKMPRQNTLAGSSGELESCGDSFFEEFSRPQ